MRFVHLISLKLCPSYRWVGMLLWLGLLFSLLLQGSRSSSAQTTSPAYWRFDAPDELSHVAVADVDLDGIDDFVVAAANGDVMLVGADGSALWSLPYRLNRPVKDIAISNADASSDLWREILILTDGGIAAVDENRKELFSIDLSEEPALISPLHDSQTGPSAMVIAHENGTLSSFDSAGNEQWQHTFNDVNKLNAQPALAVDDINRDGLDEIVYSYFTDQGFSKLALLSPTGELLWERSNSGSSTALAVVDFDPEKPKEIAVATSLDRLFLYTADGSRRWPYRSPNKPITTLEPVLMGGRPALMVGTSVGSLIAYDELGRRIWSGAYSSTADQPIFSISSAPGTQVAGNPVALAVQIGPAPGSAENSEIILLDAEGRRLDPSFPAIDPGGLSRLVDVNHDGANELLRVGFATVELLDPGIGTRHYSGAWDYRLDASPSAFMTADIDLDSQPEILVGTDNGSLHAINNDGIRLWSAELGGTISDISIASSASGAFPYISVVHNNSTMDAQGVVKIEGWLELLDHNGRQLWSIPHPSAIRASIVGDINRSGPPEIVVGTSDGIVHSYSLTGDEFWSFPLGASVDQLRLLGDEQGIHIIAGTGANNIDRLDIKGQTSVRTAEFLDQISAMEIITKEPELVPLLLVAVENNTLNALSINGNQLWQTEVPGVQVVFVPAENSVIVATDEEEMLRVNVEGEIEWRAPNMGAVTSVYWGDLDGDFLADIAAGNRDGDVRLLTGNGESVWDELNLESEVVALSAVGRIPGLQADLVAATDNGIVQLFRSSANRPPLLVNPQTEVSEGSYTISISVIDVDGDPVSVELELFNPDSLEWETQGKKTTSRGTSTLFWPVDAPQDVPQIRYRFRYDDGSHSSVIEPAAGPEAIPPSPILLNVLAAAIMVIVILGGSAAYIRQSRSPSFRARRFYNRLKQKPALTMQLLNEEFARDEDSAYFLLNLANTARLDRNKTVTSLADGLYLLDNRPESALRIMAGAVDEAGEASPAWHNYENWQRFLKTNLSLISSPTITELTLLRPKVDELLTAGGDEEPQIDEYRRLVPILNTLRDSLRVDAVDDRIVYLNEAIGLLRQLRHLAVQELPNIERSALLSVVNRWIGLVRIELEETHGRAQLEVQLLTKRLAPEKEPLVAIEITNKGRAPAENLVVTMVASPEYSKVSKSQLVPILSSGRQRQVQFAIDPSISDPFRIVFSIIYDDHHSQQLRLDFADMVHLLPQLQEFQSTANPYSPGMPLRHDSQVFYGRQELFDFIRDNAGTGEQHNVLILIGQRRTGKTSVLLQLDRHLEKDQFPVYIDCQSLGVSAGMPAFFHDMAWTIAEALSAKGHQLAVPNPAEWQEDPAGKFQREFIREARELLPEGTKIILIFDEFEAFENLVRDGILPNTLFTFLRHLMQHSEGLGFIFAGTHRLEEMGSDYWSVLFNIALYKHIGYLEEEAAVRLIRDPVAPNIVYDDLAIDKIMRVTAGHPYFLQLVCYSLVNRANRLRKAYVTISDVNAALSSMLRLGEVHFAYLWQRSTFTERALLAAAARGVESDALFQPAEIVRYLSQYSVYLDPAEVTGGLNRLVEREIMSEVAAEGTVYYKLRIGLVGLWVSENKSMSKLYESQNVRDLVSPPSSRSS